MKAFRYNVILKRRPKDENSKDEIDRKITPSVGEVISYGNNVFGISVGDIVYYDSKSQVCLRDETVCVSIDSIYCKE